MEQLENPNPYQPDGEIRTCDPDADDIVKIRCPHCRNNGTFLPQAQGVQYFKEIKGSSRGRGFGVRAFSRVCPNPKCRGLVFTMSLGPDRIVMSPPELIDFDSSSIPEQLMKTMTEAISCHAAGAYRASTMMVRRLLEELCDEAGAEGRTLHHRLLELRKHVTLPEELFEAMQELKALGNDAAHIEAKAFQTIDSEESSLSIELSKEILKARFQHQSLVNRLRARRAEAGK